MSSSLKQAAKGYEYIRTPVIDSDLESILKDNVTTPELIDGKLVLDGKVQPVVIVNKVPLFSMDPNSAQYRTIAAGDHYDIWGYPGGLIQFQCEETGSIKVVCAIVGHDDMCFGNIPVRADASFSSALLVYIPYIGDTTPIRIENNSVVDSVYVHIYYINPIYANGTWGS